MFAALASPRIITFIVEAVVVRWVLPIVWKFILSTLIYIAQRQGQTIVLDWLHNIKRKHDLAHRN